MSNSTLVITEDSINYAFSKFKRFVNVNKDWDKEAQTDALDLLCKALGVDEQMIVALFFECSARYEDTASFVFVGILLGLAMAEHGLEHYEQNV